jgi:predicted nucleic acid-binding protein
MSYMTGPLFVDTNILIYSLDPSEPEKRRRAAKLIQSSFAEGRLLTSPQTLHECYRVLTERRRLIPQVDARTFIRALFSTCTAPLDSTSTEAAWKIQDDTKFHWWDCVMLASALAAGSAVFVSEDLSDGVKIGGMRIVNPFMNDVETLFTS